MKDEGARHLTSEQLLFASPWRPVETDTTASEGARWTCLNCSSEVAYFRTLARLEGSQGRLMIQCPTCDHLHVIRLEEARPHEMTVEFGGPHIEQFLSFLDRRNEEHD